MNGTSSASGCERNAACSALVTPVDSARMPVNSGFGMSSNFEFRRVGAGVLEWNQFLPRPACCARMLSCSSRIA